MILLPHLDGVDHINVYSKGRTELGRLLTNFADTPFKHPEHGWFRTVEGFWFWLKSGMKHEDFRNMSGHEAKMIGSKWPKVEVEHFDQKIKTALRAKLIAHPAILCGLLDNNLPLAHYYVTRGRIVHPGYEWINEYYMEVRESCLLRNYRPRHASKMA